MNLVDLAARNRNGERIGLPSFCTANSFVLEATLAFAAERSLPVLIEATCNQVNQYGGYTDMQPRDFRRVLERMARKANIEDGQLLLGGDHLGPHPWRSERPELAMRKAERLVRDYVEAGFRKIHLDTSMPCGGEPSPDFKVVAERAARLAQVAETHAPDPSALVYVIGTEVPVPGGETDPMYELRVTTPQRLEETIAAHNAAFRAVRLEHAWERVISVVTQPGVDFSHSAVHHFEPDAARDLVAAISGHDRLTLEGHSTDFQSTASLACLVERHILFLKVGPELTFYFREAIFALAGIEDSLCSDHRSGIVEALDAAMDARPSDWATYYTGTPHEVSILRHYSLSDRIRYYWLAKPVQAALARLIDNLSRVDIPLGLVAQAFGGFCATESGHGPHKLIAHHISKSVSRYYEACGLVD